MHHRAKLTDDQVEQIRRLYSTGTLGYGILARAMKSSPSTIRDIVKQRTRPVRSAGMPTYKKNIIERHSHGKN